MRMDPADIGETRRRAAEKQAPDGARSVGRILDRRVHHVLWNRVPAALDSQRMVVDHRLAPVEFFPHRPERGVAEILVGVTSHQAKPSALSTSSAYSISLRLPSMSGSGSVAKMPKRPG